MRIGVTGSTGMLGTEVIKAINTSGYEAYELDRNVLSHTTSLSDTVNLLDSLEINSIIHCAANTNVELCEKEPEKCWVENSLFPETLTTAAARLGIKLVFISSTGIYGQSKSTPYIEYDTVTPTTVHHKSKYQAENFIKSCHQDYLIIRTGWLFGGNWDSKKNFVANRIKEARSSGGTILANARQFGNPTYAKDVAETIVQLIRAGHVGVFNCVSEGVASRYEYVAEIINIAGLQVKVLPAEKTLFERLAKVSDNESATNFKLQALGIGTARRWQAALAEFISESDLKK